MNMVVIPPGGSPKAHYHKDFETAIYLLKGKVETWFGKNLKESMINEEGDFVYIPAKCWHYVRALTPSISINFWF